MSNIIDQILYEQLTESCPKCHSMNTIFGWNTARCLDCGYYEKDGKPIQIKLKKKQNLIDLN